MQYPDKELVIWQMEFIDNKVTMAAANAITQVVDQIRGLRNDMITMQSELKNDISSLRSEMKENIGELRSEMKENVTSLHSKMNNLRSEIKQDMNEFRLKVKEEIYGLGKEMNTRFVAVETTLVAVETKLGMDNTKKDKIVDRVLDYSFKAGWFILVSIISYLVFKYHLS